MKGLAELELNEFESLSVLVLRINGRCTRTDCRKTANGKVVSANGDLDGLYILNECELVDGFQACGLRKVASIDRHKVCIDVILVLLEDVEELGRRIRCCGRYQDLRRRVHAKLIQCPDISLTVADLAEGSFSSIEVDEGKPNGRRDSTRF